ncbi:MAG TPA: hypothetical protein VK050_02655 [Flavobacteriaceae bacterium]|nr:hypothetical protein [Flavobacteriaceae bacterium]
MIHTKKILALIMLSAFTMFTSCSNDDREVEINNNVTSTNLKKGSTEVEIDLTNLVLKEEVLNEVLSEIKFKKDIIHELRDDEVKEILNPLLENGKVLHREMILFLEENNGFEGLSPEEHHNISYLTDEQLIELSFITYNQYQYATNSDIDWDRVRSCASFALGIQGIKTLYTNTLALGTVETMVGALKLIGKRYLGYIGIALMIYDFVDCLYGSE